MTRNRLLVVHLAVGVLVLGSGWDMLRGKDHWPFSSYPMYSRIERDTTVVRLHFYGVPERAGTPELPLQEMRFIEPFDRTRLGAALRRIERGPDAEPRLRQAAADVFARYERRRRAGEHEGPPLQGIRLYRLTWHVDPWVRNLDGPEGRELLLDLPSQGR